MEKGSDTFNTDLPVRKSKYGRYLGGLTLVTDLGCDGYDFNENCFNKYCREYAMGES